MFHVNKTTITNKPYCKVCHDAGKPEKDYTNHWVKSKPDYRGKITITCPTLLSTECRFCFKVGHTTKYCRVIKQNNKDKQKAERKYAFKNKCSEQKLTKNNKKNITIFNVLNIDSDEEEVYEVNKRQKLDFPSLGKTNNEKPINTIHNTNWVNIVATKPKLATTPVKSNWVTYSNKTEEQIPSTPICSPTRTPPNSPPRTIMKSWADYSDSETDSDTDCSNDDVEYTEDAW